MDTTVVPFRYRPFTLVAAVIFGLFALLHVVRMAMDWDVTLNSAHVPWWVSLAAAVVGVAMAWMLWRESRR
jgi:membrane associated rhomboid family serine protease